MNAFLMLTVIGAGLVLSDAVQPLGAGYNSRCVCLRLESRIIPQESLRRVEILPRGPHCKTTEVIADLSSGERICLNPKTTWVKKLILFVERKERVTKKE
ncbi:C-X-C motif chemokine 19 [Puntigrus tetrazona]|uniref:C-X-C motif chemokine 19 n=1 Tax=Puntigrus tetrazona TaxID=1606681 RepID=UPI001C8A5BC7|nr:C-X-C motif chemokine 19 [Puntigrus tetrazona]